MGSPGSYCWPGCSKLPQHPHTPEEVSEKAKYGTWTFIFFRLETAPPPVVWMSSSDNTIGNPIPPRNQWRPSKGPELSFPPSSNKKCPHLPLGADRSRVGKQDFYTHVAGTKGYSSVFTCQKNVKISQLKQKVEIRFRVLKYNTHNVEIPIKNH